MENNTLKDENEGFLEWLDWIVICSMLTLSVIIGIYYRFTGGKQQTPEEYFLADRSTKVNFLAISMMVAFFPGISLLGVSGENYSYGAQFNLIYLGLILGTIIITYFVIPIFYELKMYSVFEYLERRFGITAMLVASIANFVQYSLFTGVVLYTPSLALEAMTGLDGTLTVLLIGLIGTFYTVIGGMKAIIMTDVLHGVFMFACIYCIIGVAHLCLEDGILNVVSIAAEGGRMNILNSEIDPTARYTWLSLIVGGTFLFLTQYAVNQVQVQRILSAKTLKEAKRTVFMNAFMTISLVSIVSFSGLALYAYYRKCDPVTAGKINSYDMIMPFFAKERMSHIPCLAGIFCTGIISVSLSTFSAQLNSLALVTFTDILKPICQILGHNIPDNYSAFYGKFIAFFIGIFTMAIAFLISKFESLFYIITAIQGAIGGPILGLFTLGMFHESANETGSVIGTIVAMIINIRMALSPKPISPFLPMSIEDCSNSTIIDSQIIQRTNYVDNDSNFYLDRLSYLWYTPLGWNGAVTIGLIASIIINKFTKTPRPLIEPNLFTPIIAARIRRRRDIQESSQVFALDPKAFERDET